MVSGFLDFFSGRSSASSDKKAELFKQHIVPIVHHDRSRLNFEDCTHWVGKRVVFQLIKFERPQLGVIKYVGCDTQGLLCAGVEFDYDIGGMSGKVSGQKLFKCKTGHGLLVPVEYVQFLEDYENGTHRPSGSGSFIASAQIERTQSVPNLSGRAPSAPHPEEYIAVQSLPSGLKIGDNVVWLGGSNPLTGIVRWIGRSGRNEQLPIKAWVEMDEYLGFGYLEMDVGTKYGCAVGRGKFLPVDELILFENFFGQGDQESGPMEQNEPSTPTSSSSSGSHDHPNGLNVTPPRAACSPRVTVIPITLESDASTANLIDFGQSENPLTVPCSVAEEDFHRIVMDNQNAQEVNSERSAAETDFPPTIDELIKEFGTATFSDDSLPSYAAATSSNPFNDTEVPVTKTDLEVLRDENGNLNKSEELEGAVGGVSVSHENHTQDMPVKHTMDYYEMPPFIVPPINILDFFKATGPKGIQGKRNSCYIDVVLFSLFAFTDAFDPYFLDKSAVYCKGPDSELTKMAKKALAGQIVNPLRQNYYVSAAGINFLRDLIIPLSDKVDGAFLDVEEFMLIMFDKVFNLQEFIKYDNNMKDYIHQVNLGDHNLPVVMTLKQCLELSMADYGLKLKEVPSPAFIIQIPRNTYGIIQSTTIVPNLKLDLQSVIIKSDCSKRVTMGLVAVICIKEFHFVTFVKSGKGALSHWVLFDSNPSEERPKVEIVPNMGEWLESLEHQCLTSPSGLISNKHKMPQMVQKLLSDIYVCIYCPA